MDPGHYPSDDGVLRGSSRSDICRGESSGVRLSTLSMAAVIWRHCSREMEVIASPSVALALCCMYALAIPSRIGNREISNFCNQPGGTGARSWESTLARRPILVMSRENFEKAGLARSGNSIQNRILLRLPRGFGMRAAKQRLRALFPSVAAVDYQDVNRNTGVRIEAAAGLASRK